MKQKTLTMLSWAGLAGAVSLLALSNPIFGSRAQSFGYELVALAVGIVLVILIFFAFLSLLRQVAPNAPSFVAWLLLLLAIGVVALAKITLDDRLRGRRAHDASVMTLLSQDSSSRVQNFQ